MRKFKIAALTAVAGIALVGCANAEQAVDDSDTTVTVIDYRGYDLTCVASAYDRSLSLSCDFWAFYIEHPELLK